MSDTEKKLIVKITTGYDTDGKLLPAKDDKPTFRTVELGEKNADNFFTAFTGSVTVESNQAVIAWAKEYIASKRLWTSVEFIPVKGSAFSVTLDKFLTRLSNQVETWDIVHAVKSTGKVDAGI